MIRRLTSLSSHKSVQARDDPGLSMHRQDEADFQTHKKGRCLRAEWGRPNRPQRGSRSSHHADGRLSHSGHCFFQCLAHGGPSNASLCIRQLCQPGQQMRQTLPLSPPRQPPLTQPHKVLRNAPPLARPQTAPSPPAPSASSRRPPCRAPCPAPRPLDPAQRF